MVDYVGFECVVVSHSVSRCAPHEFQCLMFLVSKYKKQCCNRNSSFVFRSVDGEAKRCANRHGYI